MFDPSIFDNLKVILEGQVYEQDLTNAIRVTGRSDLVDLAGFSRSFRIRFRHLYGVVEAEISLESYLKDFVQEWLHQPDHDVVESREIGCTVTVHFYLRMHFSYELCNQIKQTIDQVWEGRPSIVQQLTFQFPSMAAQEEAEPRQLRMEQWKKGSLDDETMMFLLNHISLQFGRKIGEGQAEDFQGLVRHTLHTLEELDDLVQYSS